MTRLTPPLSHLARVLSRSRFQHRLPDGFRLPTDFEETDVEIWRLVHAFTLTTPARIYSLVRAVEYVARNEIPGAIVECGVWRGGSIMAVASTLLRLGVRDYDLYLFDTFEGMPEPGNEDVEYSGKKAADLLAGTKKDSVYWAVAPLDEVRDNIFSLGYPVERIHFVKGRVEETVPHYAPEGISLLRLDTDWYESTKHELVHLFPRLSRSGVLIVDDYGHWRGARQALDEFINENDLPLLLNRIDEAARIGVKL